MLLLFAHLFGRVDPDERENLRDDESRDLAEHQAGFRHLALPSENLALVVELMEQPRDFTDVRDVVRAYRLLVEHGARGEVYHVCSGVDRPVSDLAERLTALAIRKVTKVTSKTPAEIVSGERAETGSGNSTAATRARSAASIARRVSAVPHFAISVMTLPLAGFVIATAFAAAYLAWRLGSGPFEAVAVGIGTSVGIYVVFHLVLGLSLARGPWGF